MLCYLLQCLLFTLQCKLEKKNVTWNYSNRNFAFSVINDIFELRSFSINIVNFLGKIKFAFIFITKRAHFFLFYFIKAEHDRMK